MARLYELLPDSLRAKYPEDTLTPKWRQRLSIDVPPDYPEEYTRVLVTEASRRLPKATVVASKVRKVRRAMAGEPVRQRPAGPDFRGEPSELKTEADVAADWRARTGTATPETSEEWYRRSLEQDKSLPTARRVANAVGRTVLQAANTMKGYAEGAEPLVRRAGEVIAGNTQAAMRPLETTETPPLVPENQPWNTAEGLAARATQNIVGVAPFMLGASGGAAVAGSAARKVGAGFAQRLAAQSVGSSLGAGAVAATPPGTVTQRAVRGGTTAAAALLSHGVGERIAGAEPGLARWAASQAPAAALFGAAQPWAAEAINSALGEEAHPVTVDDMVEGGVEMYLVNLIQAGLGAPGAFESGARNRARRAAQRRAGWQFATEATRGPDMLTPRPLGGITRAEGLLIEAMTPPRDLKPADLTRAERVSNEVSQKLAGRRVTIVPPGGGDPVEARVHRVFVFRGSEETKGGEVRVIAEDSAGQLAPLVYPDMAAFTQALQAVQTGPQAARPRVAPKPIPKADFKGPSTEFVPEAPPGGESLPTTYTSASKGEIPIRRMATEHLRSAHSKAEEGPVKQALEAELVRRKAPVAPKPFPKEAPKAEAPKPEPKPTGESTLFDQPAEEAPKAPEKRPLRNVAQRLEDGTIIEGNPGQVHAELNVPGVKSEDGYVDQDGNFVPRAKAYAKYGYPDSMGLRSGGFLEEGAPEPRVEAKSEAERERDMVRARKASEDYAAAADAFVEGGKKEHSKLGAARRAAEEAGAEGVRSLEDEVKEAEWRKSERDLVKAADELRAALSGQADMLKEDAARRKLAAAVDYMNKLDVRDDPKNHEPYTVEDAMRDFKVAPGEAPKAAPKPKPEPGETPEEAKAPPKRPASEATDDEVLAAIEKHYPEDLAKLVEAGADDAELAALTERALEKAGWDIKSAQVSKPRTWETVKAKDLGTALRRLFDPHPAEKRGTYSEWILPDGEVVSSDRESHFGMAKRVAKFLGLPEDGEFQPVVHLVNKGLVRYNSGLFSAEIRNVLPTPKQMARLKSLVKADAEHNQGAGFRYGGDGEMKRGASPNSSMDAFEWEIGEFGDPEKRPGKTPSYQRGVGWDAFEKAVRDARSKPEFQLHAIEGEPQNTRDALDFGVPGGQSAFDSTPEARADILKAKSLAEAGGKNMTAGQLLETLRPHLNKAMTEVANRIEDMLKAQGHDKAGEVVFVFEDALTMRQMAMLIPERYRKRMSPKEQTMVAFHLYRGMKTGASPGAHLSFSKLPDDAGVVFLGTVATGINGNMGTTAILHELAHMAFTNSLEAAKQRRARGEKGFTAAEKRADQALADLSRLNVHVLETLKSRLERGKLDPGHAKFLEQTNFVNHPEEIQAWGLTDSRAQAILESIPAPPGSPVRTAWGAFVKVVREFLGVPESRHTALSELLRLTDEFALNAERIENEGKDGQFHLGFMSFDPKKLVTESLRAKLGVKRKLEQMGLEGLGELSKGTGAIRKPAGGDASDEAMKAMMGEAETFEAKFEKALADPLARDLGATTIAASVTADTGLKPPDNFDAEAYARDVRRRALSEAGQGDIFAATGVEIPKAQRNAETVKIADEMAKDAATETVEAVDAEVLAPPEMRRLKTSELDVMPEFQKREGVTKADQVSPNLIAQHMEPSEKNPKGGYNQALMDQSPLTIWRGEDGKMYVLDGHHRRFMAGHTFGKNEQGKWVVTGDADREVNAVEVFVTPEKAKQIAEYANRRTARTSYIEDAKLAARLMAEGKSDKEVAATLGVKASEAERMAHIGNIDPSAREFFADEIMRIHGGHLGKAVAAHPDYFTPAKQREYIQQLNQGLHGSAIEFAAALKQETGLLERMSQLNMGTDFGNAGFTPAQVRDATHRGLRYLESKKNELKKLAASVRALEGRAVSAEDMAALKRFSENLAAEQTKLKGVQESIKPAAMFDRIAKGLKAGIPAEKTLAEIRAEIDAQMGAETPADHIPAGMAPRVLDIQTPGVSARDAVAIENIVPSMWREMLEGTPGAVIKQIRGIPKDNRLRTVDAQGRVVHEYDMQSLYEPDYYSESALVRMMANANLLGGNYVLPRDNAVDLKAAYSEEARLMHLRAWRLKELIGEDALRLMGPYSDNAKLVSQVLSGKLPESALPAKLKHVPGAIRTLTTEIFDHANEIRRSMGLEPVKPLEGYDLPHMILGRAPELVDTLLQSFLGGVDAKRRQQALEEMRNRFFEHRNDYHRWTEDAALQLDAYISVMSRYAALAPFLRRLAGDLRKMEVQDPIRAGAVSNWLKATLLRRKSRLDNVLDSGTRHLMYAKSHPTAQDISPRSVLEAMGHASDPASVRALRKEYKSFYRVPAGVPVQAAVPHAKDLFGKPRKGAIVLYTDPTGTRFIGTQGDLVVTGDAYPELRKPFEMAGKLGVKAGTRIADIVQRVTGGKIQTRPEGMSFDESRRAAYRKWRHEVAEAERRPGSAMMHVLGGNQMRAVLGWNFRAQAANVFQPMITSAPEYGFLPVLNAVKKVGGASVVHSLASFAEKRGYMTKAQADKWRSLYPHARQRAEMLGALQGEVDRAREQMSHPSLKPYEKMVERLGSMYGYRVIEDFTRGVNVIGVEALAKRYGLNPAVAWKSHYDMNGEFFADWKKAIDATRTKGTAERLQAILDSETMFDYNALGQSPMFGGALGKLMGRLMTFPANYFPRYVTRPVGGAAKTGLAAARWAADKVTGGAVGAAKPRGLTQGTVFSPEQSEKRTLVRGLYPEARGKFERGLQKYGASWHDRQAAKVFIAQALTVGAMHGITEATGVNAMLPGTPGWEMLVLLLMYSMDPKNDKLRERFERIRRSAIISPERGVETGMGPTMKLLWQSFGPEATAKGWAGAQKAAKEGRGPLGVVSELTRAQRDFIAEFAREQIPGMVALRRGVQNVAPVGPLPSSEELAQTNLPEALGYKSYVRNKTLGDMIRGNLGLTPTTVEAERRRNIAKE